MLDFAKAMEVNSDSAEGQGSMGYQHEDTGILLLGWLQNPAPVENGGLFIPLFHPIICLGFQPSFWWCRISQPSTTSQEFVDIHGT